jgi:hypothetical protein
VLVEIKGSDLHSTLRKHGAHAEATLKFIDGMLDLLRDRVSSDYLSLREIASTI